MLGLEFSTQHYGKLTVAGRISKDRFVVVFNETGYRTEASPSSIRKGTVKDGFVPVGYGRGYYGDKSYTRSLSKESGHEANQAWWSMFKRCYEPRVHKNHAPYAECSVSNEWFDFQRFAKFFVENQYRQSGWDLDKDLLFKGNKIYGEDTCCFLPRDINGLLKTNRSRRGDLPIGVISKPGRTGFFALCRDVEGVQKYLGRFSTPEEAFDRYKTTKEFVVKKVAEKWRSQIDPKAFAALLEYEVHIDD